MKQTTAHYVIIRGSKVTREALTAQNGNEAVDELKPDKHELIYLRLGQQDDPKPFSKKGRK